MISCHTAPVPVLYLVLTSSLHLLMTQDSSNSTGNHPLTHTLSSSGTFRSSPPWSLNIYNKHITCTVTNHYCLNWRRSTLNCTMEEQYHLKSFSEIRISFLQTLQSFGQFLFKIILTWGFSATYLAQFLISRIASILVSGKAALQANSDRHFTASWNESMMDAKCFSHMLAISRLKIIRNEY